MDTGKYFISEIEKRGLYEGTFVLAYHLPSPVHEKHDGTGVFGVLSSVKRSVKMY